MADPNFDTIIANLEDALTKTVSAVRDGDQSVNMKTTAEIQAQLDYWKGRKAAALSAPRGHSVAYFGRD